MLPQLTTVQSPIARSAHCLNREFVEAFSTGQRTPLNNAGQRPAFKVCVRRAEGMTLDAEPMYCAEQINIPDNLGEILKAYAKEVIRQQPGNIYEFSARYFAQVRNWPSGAAAARRSRPHAPCDMCSASTARGLRGAGFARSLTPLCPRPCPRRAAGPARGGLHRPGRHRDFARNCIQTCPGVPGDRARRLGSGQAARAV